MEEKIVPTVPYQKEKEELLPDGTLVIIKNDQSKTERKILWSIPDEYYPHRYKVDGWSFICEKKDFI